MSARDKLRVQGKVTTSRVRVGTGSEHTAIILTTESGEELILVRKGGNPYSDPTTRKLIGKRVEVEGYRLGNEIRYTVAHEI